jgi:hypothetical protein
LSLFTLFLVLLVPGEALAWGPGVHTAAARFVLANLDLLPKALAALIAQHPNAYIYGCLSADFFVGKGFTSKPGHSHNWDSAMRLAHNAATPRLKAHALGYMSHLAADVVAHNYYVPGVMARTPAPGNLTHVYVEMQADSRLTGGHGLGPAVPRASRRAIDLSLVVSLEKNLIGYYCRKQMFGQSVKLAGNRGWNRSLRFAQKVLPLPDDRQNLNAMFDLSVRAVLDVLANPESSVIRRLDPVGGASLKLAKRHAFTPIPAGVLSLPPLPTCSLRDVA